MRTYRPLYLLYLLLFALGACGPANLVEKTPIAVTESSTRAQEVNSVSFTVFSATSGGTPLWCGVGEYVAGLTDAPSATFLKPLIPVAPQLKDGLVLTATLYNDDGTEQPTTIPSGALLSKQGEDSVPLEIAKLVTEALAHCETAEAT